MLKLQFRKIVTIDKEYWEVAVIGGGEELPCESILLSRSFNFSEVLSTPEKVRQLITRHCLLEDVSWYGVNEYDELFLADDKEIIQYLSTCNYANRLEAQGLIASYFKCLSISDQIKNKIDRFLANNSSSAAQKVQ